MSIIKSNKIKLNNLLLITGVLLLTSCSSGNINLLNNNQMPSGEKLVYKTASARIEDNSSVQNALYLMNNGNPLPYDIENNDILKQTQTASLNIKGIKKKNFSPQSEKGFSIKTATLSKIKTEPLSDNIGLHIPVIIEKDIFNKKKEVVSTSLSMQGAFHVPGVK